MSEDLYRLEVCSACGVVRVAIRTVTTMQRERDGLDRAEHIGGATVYRVDFCEPCRVGYEASLEAPDAG